VTRLAGIDFDDRFFSISIRKLELLLHRIRNQLLLEHICCIRRCIASHGACFEDGR